MRWLAVVLVSVAAWPAAAEVRIKIDPDGRRHMYNVGGSTARPVPGGSERSAPDLELERLISRHARSSTLDADLVRAVVQVESAFDPQAVSRKGAIGLMQLMPVTAREMAIEDPFDPEQNVSAGTRYLRRLLDAFGGRLELALAAYNAGPEAVERFDGIPPFPETVGYVEKVIRLYRDDPDYRVAASGGLGRGRRTYLSRGRDGLLLLSTTPPTR